MNYSKTFTFLLAAGVAVIASGAAIAETPLEARLGRIERILENQSGSDLLLKMQQLQTEMQELRGVVETQQFEIQQLKRQQRGQTLDIDSRLGGAPALGDLKPALPAGPIDATGDQIQPPTEVVSSKPPLAPPTPSSPGAVGIPSLPSPETTSGSERDVYERGFQSLKDRKYDAAKNAFNDLLRRYPQGQYADSARYWLAETYYVQRDYPNALAEFDRLVQLDPSSPKVPGALLRIGYIQYEQKAFDQSRSALQRVIDDYPDSTEARLAKSRLERIGQADR